MAQAVPVETRYTVERYFGLVETGVLHPDDRVELLEGVIVAVSPQNPPHASAVTRANRALNRVLGDRALIRVQMPLIIGSYSVPEPDLAVVSGTGADYDAAHPTTALLVVEVADSSLLQDRLTKAAVYVAAGIPEYWLVNLRDDCIEVFRAPDPGMRRYAETRTLRRGEQLDLVAFPEAKVSISDLLPGQQQ
jgi:Uma2 family endonuclease